ncbi:MAG: T9SS type A sorting domain-containing protein, partial [Flavitalea sp.]
FVRSSGSAGSVSFTEASKVDQNRLVNRVQPRDERRYIRAKLYTKDGTIADGNALVVSRDYNNTLDENDAKKIFNEGENFSIKTNRQHLAVETRNAIRHRDSIQYSMQNMRVQDYAIWVFPKHMETFHLTAYFGDKYLGTERRISLNDSSEIRFSINQDGASQRNDRFYIVFKARPLREIPYSVSSSDTILTSGSASLKILNNPAKERLHLRIEGFERGEYKLLLTDFSGKIVLQNLLVIASQTENSIINLPVSLPAGTYSVSLVGRENIITKKVVIQ